MQLTPFEKEELLARFEEVQKKMDYVLGSLKQAVEVDWFEAVMNSPTTKKVALDFTADQLEYFVEKLIPAADRITARLMEGPDRNPERLN